MGEYETVYVVVLMNEHLQQKFVSFRTSDDALRFGDWIRKNCTSIGATYVGERNYMMKGEFNDQ